MENRRSAKDFALRPEFFDIIGVRPILGRTFRPEDDVKDAPAVLILNYSY